MEQRSNIRFNETVHILTKASKLMNGMATHIMLTRAFQQDLSPGDPASEPYTCSDTQEKWAGTRGPFTMWVWKLLELADQIPERKAAERA